MAVLEPQHADVIAALRDLQQDQAFTDFTVHLKEGPVHVSRITIAAVSPVFRNMLTADMNEVRTNSVAMKHITRETWTCIKEFYYSSQKLVTIDNVVAVLEASHMYQLDKLTKYCSGYLKSVCSPDNWLIIKRIAAKLHLDSVAKKAIKVIAKNFSAVCKSADFLCLEKSELLELLEKKLASTEDDVCEALLAWMEAKDADADTCTELFQHVKLRLVSADCLGNRVVYHSMSARTPAIRAKVQQELVERMKPSSRSLVVAGGEYFLKLFIWSEDKQKWIKPNVPIDQSHQGFAVALLDDRVIITGGYGSNMTHFIDLKKFTLSIGPSLEQEDIYKHRMALVRGKAFIVAGSCACQRTKAIHEYSQASRRWTKIGDLRFATENCAVTTMGNTIIVAGGDYCDTEKLIQTFNVQTRTAAVLDDRLPRPMSYGQGISLGDAAFFVGNQGDLVQVTEVEGKFRVTSHTLLRGFGEVRRSFGVYVTDSCLHVVGRTVPATVECWDFRGRRRQRSCQAYPPLPLSLDVSGVFPVKLRF